MENLKNKFGIMSIALGGRAQKGPMQTVGGVKGSRSFPARFVSRLPDVYHSEMAKDKSLADPIFDSWTSAATDRFQLGVNGMNAYRIGDKTETPLHFVYEASDCRIWYTPEMIEKPVVLWNRVAEIAFTNRVGNVMSSEYCVEGSTRDPTSISGGVKKGEIGPQKPPQEAFPRYSGWIVNGTTITHDFLPKHDRFGPGTIAGNVPGSISNPSSSDDVIDLAALQDFRDYCADHNEDSWLLRLMCAAVG